MNLISALAALAATVVTLAPIDHEPYLELSPEGYVLCNPTHKNVRVRFWCTNKFKQPYVNFTPGNTPLSFKAPDGSTEFCMVDTWKFVK